MIEKMVFDFLNSLDGTPAYTEMPKTYPGNMYLIEKTGDSRINHINTANIAIQSYADTLYEAMELNEALKDIMLNGLITLDEIASVDLNSDYNFTDTATKRYRYQAVFVITYY